MDRVVGVDSDNIRGAVCKANLEVVVSSSSSRAVNKTDNVGGLFELDLVVDQVAPLPRVILRRSTVLDDEHTVGSSTHNLVLHPHTCACKGIVHTQRGDEREDHAAVGDVGWSERIHPPGVDSCRTQCDTSIRVARPLGVVGPAELEGESDVDERRSLVVIINRSQLRSRAAQRHPSRSISTRGESVFRQALSPC